MGRILYQQQKWSTILSNEQTNSPRADTIERNRNFYHKTVMHFNFESHFFYKTRFKKMDDLTHSTPYSFFDTTEVPHARDRYENLLRKPN